MADDNLIAFNKERWEALAQANIAYSRPLLDLTPATAKSWLAAQGAHPTGAFDALAGKQVLCLASGGGQQTAAFGLLGAEVTVFDLSETQLARDKAAADHYGYPLRIAQGDMRDLSVFYTDAFDIVWQPYSLNFSPHSEPVFCEVARVLRPGGVYRIEFANPYVIGFNDEGWNGRGYELNRIYAHGAELQFPDDMWDVQGEDGTSQRVLGPREFQHALSNVVNGLVDLGFIIRRLWENPPGQPDAEPGSWEHFTAVAPPWLGLWLTYRPDLDL